MCRFSRIAISLLALLLVVRAAFAEDTADKIVIYTAASTRAVVEEIAQQFKEDTGIEVEVVPGPSSGLARQIVEGAEADLYLSADQANADHLQDKGLVSQRRNLLTNRLVVIVPADSPLEFKSVADLAQADVKRIAVGEKKVPVGEYARQALRTAKILEQVEPKLVGAVDVKAVVQYVARGEVEAGFVYVTDTLGSTKVRVALEVDPSQHEPIEYPLVLLKRDEMQPAARTFYDYLGAERAAELFRGAGFGTIDEMGQ